MCGISKDDLKSLLITIENLREDLHDLIRQGKSPLDPVVLKLSKDLDEELNKYYEITFKVPIKGIGCMPQQVATKPMKASNAEKAVSTSTES